MVVSGDDHRHAAKRGDPGELARRVPDVVEVGKGEAPVAPPSSTDEMNSTRPARGIGRPRIVCAFRIVNSMLFTPMPMPNTSTAVMAKLGLRRISRNAKPKSRAIVSSERQPPLIAMGLLDLVDAPELALRRAPRVARRHPGGDVLLGEQVQVVGDLFLEPAFAPARRTAGRALRDISTLIRGHDGSSRRRLTIDTVRDHNATSFASWRRPAAVMV